MHVLLTLSESPPPTTHIPSAPPHPTPTSPPCPWRAPLQANFASLQALIDRIHRDAQVAEEALEDERYRQHAADPFLLPLAQQEGGEDTAAAVQRAGASGDGST